MEIKGGWRAALWLGIALGIPLMFVAAYAVSPEATWKFIWDYFWGTIETDAVDMPMGGVTEDYNPVNTVVYGLVLAASAYLLNRLFRRMRLPASFPLLLVVVPFLVLGSVLRSLEDARLFTKPLVYLMIAPIIYIFVGVLAIVVLAASVAVARAIRERGPLHSLPLLFLPLAGAGPLIFAFTGSPHALALTAWSLAALAVLILFRLLSPGAVMAAAGAAMLLAAAGPVVEWFALGGAWPAGAYAAVKQPRPWELLFVTGGALVLAVSFHIAGRVAATRWKAASPLASPENLLLAFAQFLDGFATYRGIEFFSYGEKHVLPNFLITSTGTALVMLPLKLMVILLVVYVLDIAYAKEFGRYGHFRGIIKVAVVMLGLAPGTRDMLRLAMGV